MNFDLRQRGRLCNFGPVVILCLVATFVFGCSAVQRVSETSGPERGYLRLLVEPETAEVFIDAQYQGVVSGWVDQLVPVRPGLRRVELRAPGFISQRFDVDVGTDEEVTLQLRMEPELEDVDAPSP